MQARISTVGRWFFERPYVLLVLATLFWGGNVVAGKLAVGEVSPMAVTFLRWLIVCVVLALMAGRATVAELRSLLPAWRYVVAMAVLGFTGFNALFYAAAHHTAAVNIAIIQGSTPILVLLGTLFFGARLRPLQMFGVAATMLGVVLTASGGDLKVIAGLAFNRGDVWLLLASILYAVYTLGLRRRPAASALGFFVALAAAACLTSLPLLLAEGLLGRLQWPTAAGWLILIYVALMPSLLSQVFYIRAVELIGPGRTSTFYNLVPIFGAVLSTAVLGEPFGAHHLVALALVLGGIAIAERAGA